MGHEWFSGTRSIAAILPLFMKLFLLRIHLSSYQECRTSLIIPSGLGKCLLSPGRLLQTNIMGDKTSPQRGHYSSLSGLFVLALSQNESRMIFLGSPMIDAQTKSICGNPRMIQRSVRVIVINVHFLRTYRSRKSFFLAVLWETQ
jgi:hypothetical protein